MLTLFIVCLAAFVAIILFLNWYYKKMTEIIFGKMNEMLESIVVNGSAPRQWNDRLEKLNRKIAKYPEGKRYDRALAKHIKYIKASVMDICAYARKTSFISNEEDRAAALERIERFRDETVRQFEDMRTSA